MFEHKRIAMQLQTFQKYEQEHALFKDLGNTVDLIFTGENGGLGKDVF